jgi:ribosomal protein S7
MIGGRKDLSRKIVYDALELIKRIQYKKWLNAKTEEERDEIVVNPFEIVRKGMYNCRPLMRLQTITKG